MVSWVKKPFLYTVDTFKIYYKNQQDNFLQSSSIAFGSPIFQKVFSYITTNVTDWEKQQEVKKIIIIILINLVF